jgi:hypothetical protein
LRCGRGELVAERWVKPADATGGLGEVAPRELASLEEFEHVVVDGRQGGLHQVEGEGVAVAVVGVDDAETGSRPRVRQARRSVHR